MSVNLVIEAASDERSPFDSGYQCVDHLRQPDDPNGPVLTPSLPEVLIDMRGEEGLKRLLECSACKNVVALMTSFPTQMTQAMCGAASAAAVLNAVDTGRKLRPKTAPYAPYPYYTQCNVLSDTARRQIDVAEMLENGLTLPQLRFLLAVQPTVADAKCYTPSTEAPAVTLSGAGHESVSISKTTIKPCIVQTSFDEFKTQAIAALSGKDVHLIVNFSRDRITDPHKATGGHFSPVAAYHEGTDSFLVLDVARYKYPPFWIKAELLWESMNTTDPARGYVVVLPIKAHEEITPSGNPH